MHAGDGGAQPVAGERARHLAAQLGELRDRVGHAAMHTGADLHHGRVGLGRDAIEQIGRQLGEHLVRAEGQLTEPRARIEEHELLLDPDT